MDVCNRRVCRCGGCASCGKKKGDSKAKHERQPSAKTDTQTLQTHAQSHTVTHNHAQSHTITHNHTHITNTCTHAQSHTITHNHTHTHLCFNEGAQPEDEVWRSAGIGLCDDVKEAREAADRLKRPHLHSQRPLLPAAQPLGV